MIPSPPPFLFCRGERRRDDVRSVAVVGTRQASDEGRQRARRLAEKLTADGVTVISGLVRGIDTEAHKREHRETARMHAVHDGARGTRTPDLLGAI
jgi:DNA processing protein